MYIKEALFGDLSIFIMDTSMNIRNLAICKYKSDLKQSDICRQLNLKKSILSKLIKLHKSTGCVVPRRKGRCGKKMKLNSREISLIRRESQKDRTLTAKEIQSAVGSNSSKLSLSLFCLLYTSPSPRDGLLSRMPSSA